MKFFCTAPTRTARALPDEASGLNVVVAPGVATPKGIYGRNWNATDADGMHAQRNRFCANWVSRIAYG